jgi:chemotaxis protein MotB
VVAGLIKMELLKDGLHLVLSDEILFPTASAELNDTGREVLTKLVEELEQLPYQIGVIGYTDNVPVGGRLAARYPSNWELAGARAASVVRLFQGAGIPLEQLVAVSHGEGRPIASNNTPEGRRQNRRIEVRLRPVVP